MTDHVPARERRVLNESLLLLCAAVAIGVTVVSVLTHVVAPRLLTHFEHFPALATVPKRTANAKGDAADPVNVAVVGTATELAAAMQRIRWSAADSLSRASDIAIAKSVLLNRPDSTAPVSSLFLFGRRQDVAYEQQVGASARRRHHMRLWLVPGLTYEGRPVWIGDASFDLKAGISHRGWHPTHHIAPDIDEERDSIEATLARAGQVAETFRVTGLGVRVDDHNAEGDRIDTDGEMRVMVVSPNNVPHAVPLDPGVPPFVALKDALWRWGRRLGRATGASLR